jgi:hypothetical protein
MNLLNCQQLIFLKIVLVNKANHLRKMSMFDNAEECFAERSIVQLFAISRSSSYLSGNCSARSAVTIRSPQEQRWDPAFDNDKHCLGMERLLVLQLVEYAFRQSSFWTRTL